MPEDSRKVSGLRAVYHTALCSWASPWSSDARRDVLLSLGWRRILPAVHLTCTHGMGGMLLILVLDSKVSLTGHFHLLVFSGHLPPQSCRCSEPIIFQETQESQHLPIPFLLPLPWQLRAYPCQQQCPAVGGRKRFSDQGIFNCVFDSWFFGYQRSCLTGCNQSLWCFWIQQIHLLKGTLEQSTPTYDFSRYVELKHLSPSNQKKWLCIIGTDGYCSPNHPINAMLRKVTLVLRKGLLPTPLLQFMIFLPIENLRPRLASGKIPEFLDQVITP